MTIVPLKHQLDRCGKLDQLERLRYYHLFGKRVIAAGEIIIASHEEDRALRIGRVVSVPVLPVPVRNSRAVHPAIWLQAQSAANRLACHSHLGCARRADDTRELFIADANENS